jgi:hypothetical protein
MDEEILLYLSSFYPPTNCEKLSDPATQIEVGEGIEPQEIDELFLESGG